MLSDREEMNLPVAEEKASLHPKSLFNTTMIAMSEEELGCRAPAASLI